MPPKPVLKMGTIVQEGTKFFVQVEDTRAELSPKVVPPDLLKPLVGKPVEVELSDPVLHVNAVFGTGSVRPPRIICYIPVDPFFNQHVADSVIAAEQQLRVADKLLEEKAITKEVYARLRGTAK